jgi:hypothetical protein
MMEAGLRMSRITLSVGEMEMRLSKDRDLLDYTLPEGGNYRMRVYLSFIQH